MVEAVIAGRVLRVGILSLLSLVSVTVAINARAAAEGAEGKLARQILDATEVKGGLVVHLDCGDGRLTAALHAGESYVVHGLDADAEDVRRAREYIRGLGLYGPVSVERFDGTGLPYADNLVNLVVAERLGGVTAQEAMRVLAPGGALYARQDDRWSKAVKPRPANTDEWTHFLHDASGNAVAHDQVVGPPGRVQWIGHPRHTRSHEHTPSINALVSTGGRIFYIADEGPIRAVQRPALWHLVARDAYNGLLLWKRPFSPWFPHIVNWGRTPPHLQRRLVAVGDRLYVTLGLHAPLSVVHAATGKTLKVYDETRGTEEVVCHKGILLLAVRRVTDERESALDKMAKLTRQPRSPLFQRESAEPLVTQFRRTESRGQTSILALDAETGRKLWKKTDGGWLRAETLCAVGDRVFCQKGGNVLCLDLKTGREAWSASSGPLRVACETCVVCAGGERVVALSAETGKPLWTQAVTLCNIRDAFVVNGSLWLGGFRPYQGRKTGKRGPAWGPYFAVERELATGKLLKQVEPENPGHHHRCWRNKATDRYILGGRRGVEFIDLQTGEYRWHNWVRGVCRYGVMPANGLLYAPPHACGCYIAAKLDGFYALAPAGKGRGTRDEGRVGEASRLERGPAYDSNPEPETRNLELSAWPTYRHDAQRSGCTVTAVPAALRRRWQADVGGQLTSPTVAGGKVFVASVDEHRLCALDADSGDAAWQFTAGARVDAAPTLSGGRAIFGCRDGCVYSVRASDGALAWRLRAAATDRRVAAWGQLESPWPVHGSVLVRKGVACFVAGRSSYLDGGLELCRVEPATGKVLSRTRVYSPDPETGKQPKQFGPAYMPGALSDILTSDDQHIYLRDMVFDRQGRRQPKGDPHLFTLTGFLDDTWPHRSYWVFGTRCSISTGCSGRDRNLISARLLVFGGPMIYGYGRARLHWSNQLRDGAYRLFAQKRGERNEQWTKPAPIRVRAMVLADKVLFAAGPPADAGSEPEEGGENQGGLLVAISASDGSKLAEYRLDSSPVFDGMAAANGRLYISLGDGHLVCMDARKGE